MTLAEKAPVGGGSVRVCVWHKRICVCVHVGCISVCEEGMSVCL